MLKTADKLSAQPGNHLTRLMPIAGPLLDCQALKRLSSVTFLGVLSPRFALLVDTPVSFTGESDGSRFDHSIGVAALFLDICDSLSLSRESALYAAAWGLIHDIATWPLSHTGEAAFTQTLNIDAEQLRIEMIEGSNKLPSGLHMNKALSEMGLDKNVLIELLNSKEPAKTESIQTIWRIIHSPITPDTLEGIWRTGQVFGINVPEPWTAASAIGPSPSGPVILKDKFAPVLSFWQSKADVYKKVINHREKVLWESDWSFSIAHYFRDTPLEESLYLDEKEIIAEVSKNGLKETAEVQRYKHPLEYYTDQQMYRKRFFTSDQPIGELNQILKKKKIEGDSLKWGKHRYRISSA